MSERLSPRVLAAVVGAVFVAVGVLGFVPYAVEHYNNLEVWERGSRAELFHVFRISELHNLLHLGFGVVGLVLARSWITARLYLVGGGVLYLGLWIYGVAIDETSEANVIPLDDADNWLHLGIGLGLLTLAYFSPIEEPPSASP